MAKDDLVYVAQPKAVDNTVRRVYVLPRSLVERIHKFGYDAGHQSEVAAVRNLLEIAFASIGRDF